MRAVGVRPAAPGRPQERHPRGRVLPVSEDGRPAPAAPETATAAAKPKANDGHIRKELN